MPCNWQPLVKLVASHQRFLLTTHVRPDGDGLGSVKALAAALRQQGKQARLVLSGSLPGRYAFMDPEHDFIAFAPPGDDLRDTEVLLVLDTGTWNQLLPMAEFIRSLPAAKAVIDHHVTQDDLGAQRFVDTAAEATGRLVYELVQALGVRLTPAIANPLFVALAMDTGWFRHSSVSPQTFALATELVQAGARTSYLYEQLFERNSLGRLKLMGQVLARLAVTAGGHIAYSSIERADYALTGATPPDSEDLVNFTLSLAGVEVGLLFMEQPRGGIKVSFRSRGRVNVGKIAEHFGGGGHAPAAGAIVEGPLAEVQNQVLKTVQEALPS
jgi:phosphoesterase RecJ-like protein